MHFDSLEIIFVFKDNCFNENAYNNYFVGKVYASRICFKVFDFIKFLKVKNSIRMLTES